MNTLTFRRLVPPLALALLAGGCDAPSDTSNGGFGLAPPVPLMQSRAIVVERLRPIVTIDDGSEITMTSNADGSRWRGTVSVPPNRDYAIRIVWSESVADGTRDRDLPLARLESTVSVGADGGEFVLESAGDYLYDFDDDGDGETNFAERERGTDPFLPLGVPVPDVDSADAEQPVGSVEPGAPVEVAGPDTPVTPGQPDASIEPGQPDTPEQAVTPDESGAPTEPGQPDASPGSEPPGVPVEPAEPISPVESGQPVDPAESGEPETESDPASVDLFVPRIAAADAPVLDGADVAFAGDGFGGEWASATTFDAAGSRLFIDHLMIDQGTDESDGQAFRTWGAMHDGTYLYVVVVVEDDGRRFRDGPMENELYQDDSLEVYVDGDNSKRSTYGDDDDSARLIPLLAPGTTRTGTREGLVKGFRSVDTAIEIDFATGPGLGPDGFRRPRFEQDVYELRIELDSAGIVVGRPFGFELQVNDDDDGGERDAKWGWAHPSRVDVDVDETFENPSFMGTAILD